VIQLCSSKIIKNQLREFITDTKQKALYYKWKSFYLFYLKHARCKKHANKLKCSSYRKRWYVPGYYMITFGIKSYSIITFVRQNIHTYIIVILHFLITTQNRTAAQTDPSVWFIGIKKFHDNDVKYLMCMRRSKLLKSHHSYDGNKLFEN
jgi:hypothetical protein